MLIAVGLANLGGCSADAYRHAFTLPGAEAAPPRGDDPPVPAPVIEPVKPPEAKLTIKVNDCCLLDGRPIVGGSPIRAGTLVEVLVTAVGINPKTKVKWSLPDLVLAETSELPALRFADAAKPIENGRRLTFAFPHVGEIPLTCKAFIAIMDAGEVIDVDEVTSSVVITQFGGVEPGPKPKPDDPPSPVTPLPGDGLRVLILEETADRGSLPVKQGSALGSAILRGYLDQHCVKGPDGVTPEWRILDDDSPLENESELWRQAKATILAEMAKQPGAKVPWMLASNGKKSSCGPFPADLESALAELKKTGGE